MGVYPLNSNRGSVMNVLQSLQHFETPIRIFKHPKTQSSL